MLHYISVQNAGGLQSAIYILTFVVCALIARGNSVYDGITYFDEVGECVSENSFEVFQVLDSGEALADEVKQGYSTTISTGLTVLFLNEDGEAFYDDQVIELPSGKCAKQVGIFKYTAKSGRDKTVLVVVIRDK